jgi:hypothetical protein
MDKRLIDMTEGELNESILRVISPLRQEVKSLKIMLTDREYTLKELAETGKIGGYSSIKKAIESGKLETSKGGKVTYAALEKYLRTKELI